MTLAIQHFTSTNELFLFAAQDFLTELKKVLAKKSYFDVALAGGGTAKQFFAVLKNTLGGNIDIRNIRFFFSDERVVSLESKDSNAGNAWRILLDPLAIKKDHFFPMNDGKNDAQINARNYENLLRLMLSKNGEDMPIFDLVYLGIGEDGHVASLFPHSAVLLKENLVCAVNLENILYERITLMPRLINRASRIVMMATGPEKADIVHRIILGPKILEDLPAQLIVRDPDAQGILLLAL